MLLVNYPLWTWLVACRLLGVAVVGYPVPVDRGCVLQKNSSPHQSIGLLAMLTDLFGEKLMTESNDKTYYVSICRTIPLNGSTSLAGAVKLNSKGEYVVLGEIDQAEVIVDEKTIILSYIGNDVNANLNEKCNGNRWKTFLSFICDPYAIKDTLKLVDEDPDQHKICQIKFEIQTSKICRLNSNVVVRTPVIHDRNNNLLSVINGSHYINNTQYNNRSTNNSIVNDANSNNLDNYDHDGFVYIQNKSNQQNLHQDDSNNYIREPYYKRRLMMDTDVLSIIKQNVSQGNVDINDELTVIVVKLIETLVPKPIFVIVMVAMTIYYRCFSTVELLAGKRKQSQPSERIVQSEKGTKPNYKYSRQKSGKKPKKKKPKSVKRKGMSAPRTKCLTDFYEITPMSASTGPMPLIVPDVSNKLDNQKDYDDQVSKEGKPDDNFIDMEQRNINIILSETDKDLSSSDDELNEQNEQEKNENEFIGVDKVGVEINGQDHFDENKEEIAPQVATRNSFVKIILNPSWIAIGLIAIAIIMLILDTPLGSFIFCILWIWCMLKLCKPKKGKKKIEIDENTPLIPDEDTSSVIVHIQGENKEEIDTQPDTRPKAVYDEQNKSVGARITDQTEDAANFSGESKIQNESDELVSNDSKPDEYCIVFNQGELDIGLTEKDIDLGISGVEVGESPGQGGEDELIEVDKSGVNIKSPLHHEKTEKEIASQVATGSTTVHGEQSKPVDS